MARKLAYSVTVTPDDSTEPVTFEAGSTPPDWAAQKITNEDAWVDESEGSSDSSTSGSEESSQTRSTRSRRSSGSEESGG